MESFSNESTIFVGKPEVAYFAMLAHYDDMKVAKQEMKTCPEPGCNYSSNNKSDLKDHINSRHIHFPSSKCEVCYEKFFTRRNYNRHRKSHHRSEVETAAVENGKVRRNRDDEDEPVNYRLMTPSTNESTIFLGAPREAYQAMLSHYKKLKVCKQDQIKCPERNCQYACNNKTDLKGHINSRHIHYRVFECEVCNEWFYTQKAAHSHRKNRHPELASQTSRKYEDADSDEDSERVSRSPVQENSPQEEAATQSRVPFAVKFPNPQQLNSSSSSVENTPNPQSNPQRKDNFVIPPFAFSQLLQAGGISYFPTVPQPGQPFQHFQFPQPGFSFQPAFPLTRPLSFSQDRNGLLFSNRKSNFPETEAEGEEFDGEPLDIDSGDSLEIEQGFYQRVQHNVPRGLSNLLTSGILNPSQR